MAFGLSSDLDNLFYFQFLIFFLIGFLININANGMATLVYLDSEFDFLDSDFQNAMSNISMAKGDDVFTKSYSTQEELIKKYHSDLLVKDKRASFFIFVLFWFVSPFVNIGYGVWYFWIRKEEEHPFISCGIPTIDNI